MKRRGGRIVLGRVGGVSVGVHVSGALTVLFFLWIVAQRMRMPLLLSLLGGRPSTIGPWGWGVLLACGLAISLAVHQLAHQAAARLVGGRLDRLDLRVFGDCPALSSPSVRRRIAVAVAGPVSHLVLGVALVLAGLKLETALEVRCGSLLLGEALGLLGVIELLPAPPLDGAAIAAVLLERRHGPAGARRVVGRIGYGIALATAAAGTLLASLPLIAVAAVLWAGASAWIAGPSRMRSLAGVTVGQLAEPPVWIDACAPLWRATWRMQQDRHLALAVADHGFLIGILQATDIARTGMIERRHLRARDLARRLPIVEPAHPADEALSCMRALRSHALLVVERGELVGLVTRTAVEAAATLASLGPGAEALESATVAAPRERLVASDTDDLRYAPPRRRLDATTVAAHPLAVRDAAPGVLWRRRFRHGEACARRRLDGYRLGGARPHHRRHIHVDPA